MRISDWSSDVCSSDLLLPGVAKRILGFDFGDLTLFADICVVHVDDVLCRLRLSAAEAAPLLLCRLHEGEMTIVVARSEEHTSELQSLMRISYAVFCLKKKKKSTSNKYYRTTRQGSSL